MKVMKLLQMAGIAMMLVVIAACAPANMPPFLRVQDTPTAIPTTAVTPPLPVVTPTESLQLRPPLTTPEPLPTNEQDCLRQGGTWGPQGISQMDMCDLPTTDAGLPCTDSSQCEGVCLATDSPSIGACSPRRLNFGCFTIMQDGTQMGLCVD